LEQKVNTIQASGGTEIYQGLVTGINQLRAMGDKSSARHLILMTDGHTYGDEEACYQLADQAGKEGIVISALGLGHEWNDIFLDRVTSLSGGNTLYVSSTRDLSQYMEQKINDIEKLYAHSISYHFETGVDVKLQYAFRLYPQISPLEVESPLMIGGLPYGRTMVIILEMLVSDVPTGDEIMLLSDGMLSFRLSGSDETVSIPLKLARPIGTSYVSYTPPPQLVDALARLTLYRLQERARREVGEGNITQASRHMQYLANSLLSRGDRDLAHTVLMEAEHIRQSRRFSREGDKQIKYGTRALIEPKGMERDSS